MRLFSVCAALAILAATVEPSYACGDKFLGAGRGARFGKVYAALHPGRILLYSPASSDIDRLRRSGLDKAMRRAGHQVEHVQDRASLINRLQQRPIDLVVVDDRGAADVSVVTAGMQAVPSVKKLEESTLIAFLKAVDSTMKARLQVTREL
jgi:hypothetical protein